jgi:hypothetical protein
MSIAYRCVILAMFGTISSLRGADTAAPAKFRLVHVQVLEADGRPALHRDVYLRGWDRGALGPSADFEFPVGPDDLAKARTSGWIFTTDDHGRLTVRLGNFAGSKDKAGRPGWGVYALLVDQRPNEAGAVSQRFCYGPAKGRVHETDYPAEWGRILTLPPAGRALTMRVQTGFTLRGRLVDDRDHRTPLPNVTVTTWNDLGIDTHTGYGGQIFFHTATTDADGEFEIPHEYHNKLYFKLGGFPYGTGLWMTTRDDDRWIPQEEDIIDPPVNGDLRLEFGVLINQKFHYTGRVTDAAGKPVSDADVEAGISSQPKADTYADTHHFERTKTDADGKYDLAASSPWATFLTAEDKVHGHVDLAWPGYDSPPIPPGTYNLTFPAKP